MHKSEFLLAAEAAANAAEDVIHRHLARGLQTEIKADGTPVTLADREAEQAILAVLKAAFPQHGFYGEEYGQQHADAEYLWLIDPIDGTKGFVRGTPYFSTQIALWHGGEVIAAVSKAPAFAETVVAEKGQGVERNGVAVSSSGVTELSAMVLSLGNVKRLARQPAAWACIGDLIAQVNRIRGYGDFQHYHLLASGGVDVVIESELNILDIAALSLIVREAGGVFTELGGGPITLDTQSVLAAANPSLYQRVFDYLEPARQALV